MMVSKKKVKSKFAEDNFCEIFRLSFQKYFSKLHLEFGKLHHTLIQILYTGIFKMRFLPVFLVFFNVYHCFMPNHENLHENSRLFI